MKLTLSNIEQGLKVRYTDKTWLDWYAKRNHLYAKIKTSVLKTSPLGEPLVMIDFYKDSDYEQYVTSESWKIQRFILEDRIEEPDIQRTKLERKCRKLWNQSNYVKSNPSRAY